jgi:hypothetical protein
MKDNVQLVWPDAALERSMLDDAGIVLNDYPAEDETAISNVACHVQALLQRVRELEAYLDDCERIRAALSQIAQIRHVQGSAQPNFRYTLRMVDAVLDHGADVRKVETVEALANGTWKP